MVLLIATEGSLFAVLIASYFYIRFKSPHWPPDGINDPAVARPLLNNGLLVVSALPMLLAERAVFRDRQLMLRLGLALTFLLQLAYFALQYDSFASSWRSFRPAKDAYASLTYTIIGAHWIHVGVGLLLLLWIQARAWLGHFGPRRNVPVQVTALYVYFVDALAVAVFLTTVSPAL
jgi:heme/copper-type cytochrome/quinol oxidase subunit 3